MSYMRKLENDTIGTIGRGSSELVRNGDLPYLAMAKYLVEEWGKSALRVDIDYRVLANMEAVNPEPSYVRVRRLSHGADSSQMLDYRISKALLPSNGSSTVLR